MTIQGGSQHRRMLGPTLFPSLPAALRDSWEFSPKCELAELDTGDPRFADVAAWTTICDVSVSETGGAGVAWQV